MSSSSPAAAFRHFTLKEIKEATNKFDKLLGVGGEAKVYLGEIYIGPEKRKTQVAVKVLQQDSSEFENEIATVSKIRHQHIVSLLGYCEESKEKILIYEYMQKGSLSDYLNNNNINICLSWMQRLNVCLGVARGLQHLHKETKELPRGIIHRDMKPANILLDGEWNAKVSDFGMLKLSHADQTKSAMTTRNLRGTNGYIAPEYIKTYQVSRKIDVYALGVIMFEVLCGKKPWDRVVEEDEDTYYISEDEDLGAWAQQNVDEEIEAEISEDSLEAFTEIIGKCLRPDPNLRPTMDAVVQILEIALDFQKREDDKDSDKERFDGFRAKAPSRIASWVTAEHKYDDTIVVDIGGGFTKAGFASQSLPSEVYETVVAHMNYRRLERRTIDPYKRDMTWEDHEFLGFWEDGPFSVGVDNSYKDDRVMLGYPVKDGLVSDWGDYKKILHHTFDPMLSGRHDLPVIVTAPPSMYYIDRNMPVIDDFDKWIQVMFEHFEVPAFYYAYQPVLSLYANGLTTGIVVESGEDITHSVPVYEGHALLHAITSLNLAGRALTDQFTNFPGIEADRATARKMKEELAYIAFNYNQEKVKISEYELPDGKLITVGYEQFQIPEVLFDPSIVDMDAPGIHKNTFDSITRCDLEIQEEMYTKIVLSGGTTLLPGFARRLKKEIRSLVPRGTAIKIWAPDNRKYSAWVGGSVLASLSTFEHMWISKEEYDEEGSYRVRRKII